MTPAAKRSVRFCTKCGRELVLTIGYQRNGFDGDMAEVGKCPAYHVWSTDHDYVLIREWNVGPLYDPYTGERRRD